ncbi:unnamed protein product, partial [Iphiclides podalirius]
MKKHCIPCGPGKRALLLEEQRLLPTIDRCTAAVTKIYGIKYRGPIPQCSAKSLTSKRHACGEVRPNDQFNNQKAGLLWNSRLLDDVEDELVYAANLIADHGSDVALCVYDAALKV